ncbi:unnamed protein product [Camellia sinensis]
MCQVNDVPICLMYGKEDPWVKPVWGLQVKRRLPEAPYYEISPAGHCPHDEVPEKNYKPYEEKEWYFFTPRDRKYKNGKQPNRAADDGYWKVIGTNKTLRFMGADVGFRTALVFYKRIPPKGEKTNWIMHEYRLPNNHPKAPTVGNEMRASYLIWVCRVVP